MSLASAMLKKSKRKKDSRGKSTNPETVSLPANFSLTTISRETSFHKQLPKYVALKPNQNAEVFYAFPINLNRFYFYAFFPFIVLSRVLLKIQNEKAEGVMVVPVWPTQTWYTSLLKLLVDIPI